MTSRNALFIIWLLLLCKLTTLISGTAIASDEDFLFHPLVGHRFPPAHTPTNTTTTATLRGAAGKKCQAYAICVGPQSFTYPIGRRVGVVFQSRFIVPELPQKHNPDHTTYYDYFNIYFPNHPSGGHFNQFVPQLMLGNALANSTVDYKPQWIKLDTWHIGAQYFMGLLKNDNQSWDSRAATGKLISVDPGEIIETRIKLVKQQNSNRTKWILEMFVVDDATDNRISTVVVDQPYMGLVNSTISWEEDYYENVAIGSCLENYGMESSQNYPEDGWHIHVHIKSPLPVDGSIDTFWSNWTDHQKHKCSWQPKSNVQTTTYPSLHAQHAIWDATQSNNNAGEIATEWRPYYVSTVCTNVVQEFGQQDLSLYCKHLNFLMPYKICLLLYFIFNAYISLHTSAVMLISQSLLSHVLNKLS